LRRSDWSLHWGSYTGTLSFVRSGTVWTRQKCNQGSTPLYKASSNCHVKVARVVHLLSRQQDFPHKPLFQSQEQTLKRPVYFYDKENTDSSIKFPVCPVCPINLNCRPDALQCKRPRTVLQSLSQLNAASARLRQYTKQPNPRIHTKRVCPIRRELHQGYKLF